MRLVRERVDVAEEVAGGVVVVCFVGTNAEGAVVLVVVPREDRAAADSSEDGAEQVRRRGLADAALLSDHDDGLVAGDAPLDGAPPFPAGELQRSRCKPEGAERGSVGAAAPPLACGCGLRGGLGLHEVPGAQPGFASGLRRSSGLTFGDELGRALDIAGSSARVRRTRLVLVLRGLSAGGRGRWPRRMRR